MLPKGCCFSMTCNYALQYNTHWVVQACPNTTGSWKQQQIVIMLCGFPIANHGSFACPIATCFKAADMLSKQAGGGWGHTSVYVQDMRTTIASMQTRCQTYSYNTLTHWLSLQHIVLTLSHHHKHTRLHLSELVCRL